jgi:hypothetical protein
MRLFPIEHKMDTFLYPFCAQSGKGPKRHGGELMLHDACHMRLARRTQ